MKQRFMVLALTLSLLSGCGAATENPSGRDSGIAETGTPQTGTASGRDSGIAEAGTPQMETASGDVQEESTEGASRVADASEMAEIADIVPDGLQPVYASDLNDGTYSITADSSSSMFRVTDCVLIVSGDTMTAVLTMGGTGYLYVYPGSASEAAAAPQTEHIPFAEDADGAHTFTIPVAALDTGVSCAAYSKNRELWYDRTLLFRSDSLPLEAFAEGVLVTPETLGLADGAYTAEVTLSGGSGKASVASPAPLTVRDGAAVVTLTWSSPNYDYMKVGGETYLPVNADGNSVFEIPVAIFDRPTALLADTVAMSQPYEIEYALIIHSDTVKAA